MMYLRRWASISRAERTLTATATALLPDPLLALLARFPRRGRAPLPASVFDGAPVVGNAHVHPVVIVRIGLRAAGGAAMHGEALAVLDPTGRWLGTFGGQPTVVHAAACVSQRMSSTSPSASSGLYSLEVLSVDWLDCMTQTV